MAQAAKQERNKQSAQSIPYTQKGMGFSRFGHAQSRRLKFLYIRMTVPESVQTKSTPVPETLPMTSENATHDER